jgi:hypothetical protein
MMNNPWLIPSLATDGEVMICDSESRLAHIRESHNLTWLRQVIAWPDNQLSVRRAALARFNKLLGALKKGRV